MPATVAFSSQLSELQVTITGTPTAINQIRGLKGPGSIWVIRDITCLSSPSNYMEKLPITKDTSPVSFQLIWDPANAAHEYLRASNAASVAALEAFKEVFTNAGGAPTAEFSAYVTKFEPSLNHGEEGIVDVELTPTGPITWTA